MAVGSIDTCYKQFDFANDRIWTPPHCKHSVDDSHGTTAYVYSASVVGIR